MRRRPAGVAAAGRALLLAATLAPPALGAAPPEDADWAAPSVDGWALSATSERHADAIALRRLADARPREFGPRAGRNLAHAADEVRLQRDAGRWHVAVLARQSASIVTDGATLRAAAQLDGAVGRTPLRLRYRDFAGAGVEASRDLVPWPGWRLRAGLQVLALGRWREQQAGGWAQAGVEGGWSGGQLALQADRFDSRLRYPFMPDGAAARGAALLGLATLSTTAAGWALEASARDLGWLRWRGLPQQQAQLATDTRGVDAEGWTVYGPLVQGRYRVEDRTAAAPWQASLRATRALGESLRVGASLRGFDGSGPLPAVHAARTVPTPLGPLDLAAEWRLHERRLTLQGQLGPLALTFGRDRADGSARSQAFGIRWHVAG